MTRSVLLPWVWMLCVGTTAAPLFGEDWNQWRGPRRDGAVVDSVALIDRLPAEGLAPAWVSEERLEGGGNGGWSSPVVSSGRVFIFTHHRSARDGVQLPQEKYPPLTDDRRESLSQDEINEYERKRQIEQKARRDAQFRYQESVIAWDADHGRRLWTFQRNSVPTGFGQSGTPAVVDGRLYFLGADRTAVCLEASTGAKVWKSPLPVDRNDEQIASSVAVAQGVVAVLAEDLFGLDSSSGQVLWRAAKSRMTGRDSSPVVWRNGESVRFVVNVNGGDTVCVDPKTGIEIWRVRSDANRSTPVIVGDRLITLGDNRKSGLRCFTLAERGAELTWTYQGICDPGASPVVVGRHVYVQGENRLACIDLDTGKPEWKATLDLPQPRYASLVASDEKIFYLFDGLLVFAADPSEFRPLMQAKMTKNGRMAEIEVLRKDLNLAALEAQPKGQEESQRIWQRDVTSHGPLNCSSPAIANGRLYVRRNHDLVCYDLASDSAMAARASE